MALPKHDPAELKAADLTEDEADGICEAMEALDRGEGISAKDAFAQVREELEALAHVEEQRSRARRTG